MVATPSGIKYRREPWRPHEVDRLIELYLKGHSYKEIAQLLGRKHSTIGSKLNDIRLGRCLDAQGLCRLTRKKGGMASGDPRRERYAKAVDRFGAVLGEAR